MKKILLGSGVVVICVLAAFWFAFIRAKGGPLQAIRSSSNAASSEAAAADSPPLSTSTPQTQPVSANTRRYENAAFHFSLVYPSELQVEEYAEQGGALTVTFQDPNSDEGFEVYVTPYAQSQVTQQRFDTDEPSGVMNSPTAIVIAGAPATMFFGNNTLMGDTREVWFIRGGFLYEVATYKNLDAWLSQIMSTWAFI